MSNPFTVITVNKFRTNLNPGLANACGIIAIPNEARNSCRVVELPASTRRLSLSQLRMTTLVRPCIQGTLPCDDLNVLMQT